MSHGKNPLSMIAWILLIIGGLNWGLDGIGMLAGQNLNVVNLLFGSMPTLEAIIYILVGLSGLYAIIAMATCKECKK